MFEQTSVNTWRWYRSDLKLDDITGEAGADFAAHRQAQGLEVASVNASLRILRRVLKLAVEWGVIQATPKLKLLRGERHRERVVTPDEEARYLAAVPDTLTSVGVLLVDTGMWPDEWDRLCWENITFANGRNGTLLITHKERPPLLAECCQ